MGDPSSMYDYQGLTAERTLVVMLHDLRGPTNTIVGEAKLLLENTEALTEDEKELHLQTIQQVAERINTIIESVALSEQVLRLNN